jgi:thioredoxin-related protein
MNVNLDGVRRRSLLAIGGGVAACLAVPSAWSASSALPYPQSLADELAHALKVGQPLVVMVSLDGCPFCRVARDSYLAPMMRQEGVPVVQIDMRTAVAVRDFRQSAMTHDALARAWGIKVAPTVLFFGPGGKEVAERLVGGYIPDFYGAYLDERMQTARAAIKP